MDLSIIIVSYDTRAWTLRCLHSVFETVRDLDFEVIVVDNASPDDSADVIGPEFPQVTLMALDRNIGFGRGVNRGAEAARGEYLLLLNPDTEIGADSIETLVRFAREHPDARIWGGRTVFEDGTLNPLCCTRRTTPWSLFCVSVGLNSLFPGSSWFNSENYGRWPRDTTREVDIVQGAFLLIPRVFFEKLGGFDPIFFWSGEEVDLCLRARARGARPRFTPDAEIVHQGSLSARVRADRMIHVLFGKRILVRKHMAPPWRGLCIGLLVLWPLSRALVLGVLARVVPGRFAERAATWREIWRRRGEWLHGTPRPAL